MTTGATISFQQWYCRGVVALLSLGIGAGLPGCDSPAPAGESSRIEEPDALEPGASLQRAELREDDGVVDGDTLRLVGFDETVRAVCTDTEETLEKSELKRARRDWEAYRSEQVSGDDEPADYGTPAGNEATRWARNFFDEHGPDVWLEYPSPRRTRGFFGRHLAYVWVRKGGDGEWLNFNVEAVRAGMTPYHTDYGWCSAHHDAFRTAQRRAREANRGIWAEEAKSYPDYDRRLERWNRRAEQIERFRRRFDQTPGVVELGTDGAMARLRYRVGRPALVFGAVDRIVEGADPPRLELYHRHRTPFRVATGADWTLDRFGIDPEEGQYLYVYGTVTLYRGDPALELDDDSFVRPGDSPPSVD